MVSGSRWRLRAPWIGILLAIVACASIMPIQALYAEDEGWVSEGDTFKGRDMSTFVDGDIVYVAHMSIPSGKLAVRKLENGVWSSVGPVTITDSNAYDMSMYVYNGVPYVAFDDGHYNYRGVSVMRYDTEMNEWAYMGPRGFSGADRAASEITLAVDRGEVYVAYQRYSATAQYEAYVKKYHSDTGTWEDLGGEQALDRSYWSNGIGMQVADGVVYISRNRNYAGNSYYQVEKFDDTVPDGSWIHVTGYGSEWHVSDAGSNFSTTVHEGRLYNAHINFYGLTNVKQAGANWQSIGVLGNKYNYAYSHSSRPVIRWHAGIMYVAYSSSVDGIYRIGVDRFDGMEWTTLGNPIVAPDDNTYYDNLSLHVEQGKLTLSMTERVKGASSGDYKLFTYIDEVELDIPPAISADARERGRGDEVVLTFEDDPLWRERVVRVVANGRTLYEDQDYAINEGSITIFPGSLDAGFQTISVQSEGYLGATVIQTVKPDPPATVSVESEGDSYAQVAWSAVAGADTYTIYYAKSPNPRQAADAESMTVSASLAELKVIVPNLVNGDTYYFAITSQSDGLESGTSAEVQAMPRLLTDEENQPWQLLGASSKGQNPSLYIDDGTPFMAYRDDGAISVLVYEDDAWQVVGNRKFTIGNAFDPVVTVHEGIPYVIYTTTSDQAIVMKHDGGDWTQVGMQPVSTNPLGRYSLLVHKNILYVAYLEAAGSNGTVNVKRLILDDGAIAEWQTLGDLSAYGEVRNGSMMLRQGGDTVWLTVQQAGASELRILQWDLTDADPAWQPVAVPTEIRNSPAAALAADSDRLYYARIRINAAAERVMEVWSYERLTEQWLNIGNHIAGYQVDMQEDQGTPYVAYLDPESSEHRVIVKKYVNGAWYQVGSLVYPRGTAVSDLSLAVQGYQPYVTYYNNSYYVELRSLDYGQWCAVTFDPRAPGSAPWTVELPCGEPLSEPAPGVEKPNYHFEHWADGEGQPFDFAQRIDQPVDLHAVWNLGRPENVTADHYGDKQITLQWDAVPGATGYRIYRSTDADSVGTAVGLASDTQYTDEGLVNGERYYYVVSATDGEVESAYSDAASGMPRTHPDEPQAVAASVDGMKAVLRFDQPDDGGSAITGYRVTVLPDTDSGLDSYEHEDVLLPDPPAADPVELTLDGLQTGIGYAFRVAAVNGEGASGWSSPTERVIPYVACTYMLYGKDGSTPIPATQPCIDMVEEPPARAGFDFGGWFKDENFIMPFIASEANHEDVLPLYAKWTRTSEPLAVGTWHVLDHMVDRKFHLDAVMDEGELVEAYWDAGYLSVRRYADDAWEQVGDRQFAEILDGLNGQFASLLIAEDNLYVAFNDGEHYLRLMKLGPGAEEWSDATGLTNIDFTGTILTDLSLVMSGGTPYALVSEFNKLSIIQWDEDAGQWIEADMNLPLGDIFITSQAIAAIGSKLHLAYAYIDLDALQIGVAAWSLDTADPEAGWIRAGDASGLPVFDYDRSITDVQLTSRDGVPLLTLFYSYTDQSSEVVVMRLENGEWTRVADRQWEVTDVYGSALNGMSVATGSKTPYILYSTDEWNMADFTSSRVLAVDRMNAGPSMVGESMQPTYSRLQAMELLQAGDRLYAIYAATVWDLETYEEIYHSVVQTMTLAACSVHFVSEIGLEGVREDVICGEPAAVPTEPHRTGYIFAGWYEDEAGTQPYSFDSPVTADMELYAHWVPDIPDAPSDTAVRGTGDGYVQIGWSPVPRAASYNVYVGMTAGLPGELAATVTDTVYTATGLTNGSTYYYSVTAVNVSGESGHGEQVSATPDRAMCTVSFDSRGGSAVDVIFVPCGDAAARPDVNPALAGYVFTGWYTDADLSALYDFSAPVVTHLTLYAGWVREAPNGAPEQLTVQEVGDGYVRIGWSAVPQATGYNVYVSTTDSVYGSPTASVTDTVYAAMDLVNGTRYYFAVTAVNESGESASAAQVSAVPGIPACTVVFDSTGGSAVVPQIVPCGDSAYKPSPDPVRTGFRFVGWYTDTAGTLAHDFGAAVAADLNLYAGWEAAPPDEGGEEPEPLPDPDPEPGPGPDPGPDPEPDPDPGTDPGTEPGADPDPASGGSSGSGSDAEEAAKGNEPRAVEIWVNGKREQAGMLTVTEAAGTKVASMTVSADKLDTLVTTEAGAGTLTLPFVESADVVAGILTGDQVKKLEQHGMKIEVRTDDWRYEIDAALIQVDRLIAELGEPIEPEDIEIRVEIAWAPDVVQQLAANAAAAQDSTVLAVPVRFTVKGIHNGQEVEASTFDRMVGRMVKLPEGTDPGTISTAAVIEPDGTLRHVPTRIVLIDGHYYASISSLTNSDYTLIAKTVHFEDVEHHWSRDIVYDLGSRLILNGYGDKLFRPDRHVTRGEFAAMLVRALGLHASSADNVFQDVQGGAIHAAYERGLIRGYADGTFRPADRITRQEAMVMVARAMELTHLPGNPPAPGSEAADRLPSFEDGGQVADWARDSAEKLLQFGIVSGRDGRRLDPEAWVTRAEIAAMLQRLLRSAELIDNG